MKKFLIVLFTLLFAAPALAGTAPNYNPPFGMWRLPANLEGTAPYNLTALAFDPTTDTPATVIAALNTARAAKMHVFISIMDFANLGGDWKTRYSVWCPNGQCMNLQPYVADGTLLGMHIFEYIQRGRLLPPLPNAPSLATIQQVGAVVKSLWPYMPVAIDTAHPCGLTNTNWQGSVDIVLITFFTQRWSDYSAGEALINQDAACAKQAGLRFTLGPNPFGGIQAGLGASSLANFQHFIEYALMNPDSMGTIVWRWWPGTGATVSNGHQTFANFWSSSTDPGVTGALQEIQGCAMKHTAAACPHGAPGGP